MPLYDDPILGRVIDDMEPEDETQEDLNSESLYLHDKNTLIASINKRVSLYELKFLFDSIQPDKPSPDNVDLNYWMTVLKEISQHYSLNNLKYFISEQNAEYQMVTLIKNLLLFLKVKMIELIKDGQIKSDITREDLEKKLNEIEAPSLMKWGIKFIDKESYEIFIRVIFDESKLEYSED